MLEVALKNARDSAKTKPVQQFVVQRERKLRKFSGDASEDFADWRAEAETFIDYQQRSGSAAVSALFAALGAKARMEITLRKDACRTPTELMKALKSVFGDQCWRGSADSERETAMQPNMKAIGLQTTARRKNSGPALRKTP